MANDIKRFKPTGSGLRLPERDLANQGDGSTTRRGTETLPTPTRTANQAASQEALTGAVESPATTGVDTNRLGRSALQGVGRVDTLPSKKDADYDHIFVGGGTAAATAAARMAERGLKVLLLEAGHDPRVKDSTHADPIESKLPAAHGLASESPRIAVDGTSYKVKHRSDDAKNAEDPNWDPNAKGVLYPRGEKVGGSSNMNAMIWVRPDDRDLDLIAEATGNDRWKSDNVKQIFQRIERVEYRPVLRMMHELGKALRIKKLQNPHGLGMDGWLSLNRPSPKLLVGDKQLLKMVWETAKFSMKDLGSIGDAALRLMNNFDPNDDRLNERPGLTLTPLAVDSEGRRNGPRDRLFEAREDHPDLIEIRAGASVDKVLLDDDNEAVGVRYRDDTGKVHDIAARHGVVISAGAFGTPAVLKRSGIGTKEELEPLGIKTRVELPGVGEGLSDRYEYSHTFRLKKPLSTLTDLQGPLKAVAEIASKGGHSDVEQIEIQKAAEKNPALQEWLDGKGGALATNGALIAFQAKSDPSVPEPDLYFFLVPGDFHGYHDNYSKEAAEASNMMSLVILHENKGDQKGTVKLNPDDIHGQPLINFKYHEEDNDKVDDRLPLAKAVLNMGRPLIKAFGGIVEEEVLPGTEHKTLEQIAEKIGKGTWGHHANHTARIGSKDDPMTVVDGDLQVIGTKGLYVADASVLHNPGSFIVSSVTAVGEIMADIAQEHVQKAQATTATKGLGGPNAILAAQLTHAKNR